MKAIASLILSLLLTIAGAGSAIGATQSNTKPITEDGIIRLLANKIAPDPLIREVEKRGVAFQLTSLFQEQLTEAGGYLGKKGLEVFLTAIRENFRPPVIKPYRLTYRLLKGHAVDLLLDGKIGRWDRDLGASYFVVQNEVFKTLSDLVFKFSEEFDRDKFFRSDGAHQTSRRLAAQYKKLNRGLFVGTGRTSLDSEGLQVGQLESHNNVSDLVNSLNNTNEQWRFYASRQLDILGFRRFSGQGDLDDFERSPLQEFYAHITRDYLPPDFGIIQLWVANDAADESCGDQQWTADFFGPVLRLNVAIIENVSSESISVGRFILKEHESQRLQSREEVLHAMESQSAKRRDLFAPALLKPGESLVVPIELSLKMERQDLERLFNLYIDKKAGPISYARLLLRAKTTGGLRFPVYVGGTEHPSLVHAETLEGILKRAEVNFLSTGEYLYGPTVSIESLEINRFDYLVRRFNPSNLLITSGYDDEGETGSCPFVYTYSARENSWLREGVILYGKNSKLKASTDNLVLHRFDGRVMIREEDLEDSVIDSIQIRAIGGDGSETRLLPQDVKLRLTDGDYVGLKHGDHLLVHFDMPKGLAARKYVLEASGYYVPRHKAIGWPGRTPRPQTLKRRLKYRSL